MLSPIMQEKRPSVPLVVIVFGNMALIGFMNSIKGVSFPLMRNGFNVSYNDMGLMNALIFVIAVCSCIVSGIYMNRSGLKKTVIAALLLLMLGAGSLYFSTGLWMAMGFYFMLQAGICFFEVSLNGTGVRIFTVRPGLMMNLLHFFFGLGAIGGPRFIGFMVNRYDMSWQEVYPLTLVPIFSLLIGSLMIRFPGKVETTASQQQGPSFWAMLKEPMVWHFGLILGIASSIEGCSIAWSGLYLLDVHGLDPSTFGAAFVSSFFMLYTLSRLLSGFVIEKTGYMRSIFVSGLLIIIILITAFSLGRRGVYLLPVVGFFIAVMWPIAVAISIGVFKERAQTASSAIVAIAFTLNGAIQYGVGLTNRFVGAAWGYRSCVIYSIILGVLLFLLLRRNKICGWNIR